MESWGEMRFVGCKDDASRLRLDGLDCVLDSAEVSPWFCGLGDGGGMFVMFPCGRLLVALSLADSGEVC